MEKQSKSGCNVRSVRFRFYVTSIVTVSDFLPATVWSPVNNATFNQVFGLSGAAVFASMMAYLFAQFIDIRLFHY